jgi:hypothetical protein
MSLFTSFNYLAEKEPQPIPLDDLVFWLSGESYAGSGDWVSVSGSLNVSASLFGNPTYSADTGTFIFTEFDGAVIGDFSELNYRTNGQFSLVLLARYTGSISDKHGRILVSRVAPGVAVTNSTFNWLMGAYNDNTSCYYSNAKLEFVFAPSGSYDTQFRTYVARNYGEQINVITDFTSSADFIVDGVLLGEKKSSGGGFSGFYGLGINTGSFCGGTAGTLENSNCEVGDILLYNRKLTIEEADRISTYLTSRL